MHAGAIALEGGLWFVHETGLGDFMVLFQADIEIESGKTRVIGVVHRFVVVLIGLTAELPDEHFPPPMVILRRHAGGDADLSDVACAIDLGQLLGCFNKLVEGGRRGFNSGFVKEARVVEERKRADCGRQRIIGIPALHRLHHREEFCVDPRRVKDIRRQRLNEVCFDIVVQPAIKQLHHIRAFSGGNGRGHLGAVVSIREVGHLDGDVGIGRLEFLDQLLHGIDTRIEKILPIFDFDSHCRAANEGRKRGHAAERRTPEKFEHRCCSRLDR